MGVKKVIRKGELLCVSVIVLIVNAEVHHGTTCEPGWNLRALGNVIALRKHMVGIKDDLKGDKEKLL